MTINEILQHLGDLKSDIAVVARKLLESWQTKGMTKMSDYEKYLFRGKEKDSGKWIYGDLRHISDGRGGYILCIVDNTSGKNNDVTGVEVIPETVGMFIMLTDKNRTKIFEGDIIEINHPYAGKFVSDVIWDMDCWSLKDFYFTCFDYPNMAFSEGTEYMKVIGNIHDNPELLKKE